MKDLNDIRPMIEMLPFWEKYMWFFLLILGAVVMGVIIWGVYNFLNKDRKEKEEEVIEREDPYERGMRRLEEARVLMVEGADKALATELSGVIREYLESGHGMRAREVTTEEFLVEIVREGLFKGEIMVELRHFMELCDVAKFAKRGFEGEEREMLYKSAKMFIEYAQKEKGATR